MIWPTWMRCGLEGPNLGLRARLSSPWPVLQGDDRRRGGLCVLRIKEDVLVFLLAPRWVSAWFMLSLIWLEIQVSEGFAEELPSAPYD
jgi:hypothetical protein